jgi:alanyl-tRNA synthetase
MCAWPPLVVEYGQPVPVAGAGTEVEVVLNRTPLYAEGGGQLADTGRIVGEGFEVDASRRRGVSRSHSATQLVHAGVRRALGTQAAQAGSLNAPGRLRFDFTSPGGAVPASVIADVEDEVNDVLLNDYDVRADITTLPPAARRASRRPMPPRAARGRGPCRGTPGSSTGSAPTCS